MSLNSIPIPLWFNKMSLSSRSLVYCGVKNCHNNVPVCIIWHSGSSKGKEELNNLHDVWMYFPCMYECMITLRMQLFCITQLDNGKHSSSFSESRLRYSFGEANTWRESSYWIAGNERTQRNATQNGTPSMFFQHKTQK